MHADIHVLHTGVYLLQVSHDFAEYKYGRIYQNPRAESQHGDNYKHHDFTNSRNAHGPSLKGIFVTPLSELFFRPLLHA